MGASLVKIPHGVVVVPRPLHVVSKPFGIFARGSSRSPRYSGLLHGCCFTHTYTIRLDI